MGEFDVSGFLASFFDEAGIRLQSINQKLVLLESGELDEEGLIQLKRDIHTIKGSAQMLGVQDISEISHLLEDAVESTVSTDNSGSSAMLQFMFELHDHLQERMKFQDGKPHMETTALHERFEQLKQGGAPESTRAETAIPEKQDQTPAAGKAPQPGKKRRSTKVPRHLISAIMGSIESSLEKEPTAAEGVAAEQEAEASESETLEQQTEPENEEDGNEVDSAAAMAQRPSPGIAEKEAEVVNFRPDIRQLESSGQAGGHAESGKFLRVDQTRLSRLSNQIIELSSERYREHASRQQLQEIVQSLHAWKEQWKQDGATAMLERAFDQQLRQLELLSKGVSRQQADSANMLNDLRDQVLGLMLRPLSSVFSVFPRAVRDIAAKSGKKVQLLVGGEAVEMDQIAAAALSEPMVHMINNAVAHGIESPDERKKNGKPPEGQITITASRVGPDVQIQVTDDGRGMDETSIAEHAVATGLVTETEAAEMDASELLELVFYPGFSTQSTVTDSAGRGMGMSAVLDAVRELTGTVHIHTRKGEGTRITLTIPATAAVQEATLFDVGEQRFAILQHYVVRVIGYGDQEIKHGHGPYSKGYIDFDEHRAPLIDLREMFTAGNGARSNEQARIIIVEHLEGYLGVVTEGVVDHKEVMVREIDPYLKRYNPVGLMGCTIDDDGSVLLLVEPNGLKEMWRTAPDSAEIESQLVELKESKFNHRIMLVDDSSIARQIEKQLFETIGFTVDTAIGAEDTLQKISLNEYDLLVTDLEMPEVDGIEMIQRLREEYNKDELPILVIATRDTPDEQQRALDAGADAYLVKRRISSGEDKLIATLSGLLNIDEEDG